MALYDAHLVRADSTSVRAWWRLGGDSWNDFAGVRAHWFVQWRGSSEFSHQSEETITNYGDVFESSYSVPENATAVRVQLAVLHNSSGRDWNEGPIQMELWGNPRDMPSSFRNNGITATLTARGEDVRLSWRLYNVPYVDHYEVEWYEYASGSWALKSTQRFDEGGALSENTALFSPSAGATSVCAAIKAVATRDQWYMNYKFTDSIVNPKWSAEEQAKMATPPAVTPSVAVDSSGRAVVAWSYTSTLATKFEVYRFVNGTRQSSPAYSTGANVASEYRFYDALERGKEYSYQVYAINGYRGCNATSWGWASDAVCREPSAPVNLSLASRDADSERSSASIQATWSFSGLASTVDGYEIQWCSNGEWSSADTGSAMIDSRDTTRYLITGLDANKTYHVRVRAKNPHGSSPWSNQKSILLRVKPRVPTVSAAMQDGRPKVTVTCDDANAAFVYIYRRAQGGEWPSVPVARLPRKQTITWFDGGTAPGNRYSYRAQSVLTDASVKSDYSAPTENSGWIEREPAAPTGLRAEAVGVTGISGTVRLHWANAGVTGTGYEVRYTDSDVTDPTGESTGVSSATFDGTLTQADINGLDAAKTWRLALCRTSSAGSSEWARDQAGSSTIVSVTVAATPEAPTTVATPLAVEAGGDVSFEWLHNCADGSAQQDAQVQVKVGDGAWATVASNLGGQSYHDYDTASLESGAQVSWRARTKGLTAWSEWSEARTFRVWAPAQVGAVLTQGDFMPLQGGDLESLPLHVTVMASVDSTGENQVIEWWCDVSSIGGYEARAADGTGLAVADGEVVWSRTIRASDSDWADNGSSCQFDINAQDMRFVGAFRISVGCLTAQGLASRDDATVVTCVLGGDVPQPDADITVDEEAYSCAISPFCHEEEPDEDGNPVLSEGISLSVYRIDSDGAPQLVESGMPNDGTVQCFDPHPLFGSCTYRVVATDSATGSQSVRDVAVDMPSPGLFLQWGGKSLLLPFNISLNEKNAPDVAFNGYSGRPNPVAYRGTQLGRTYAWSSTFHCREHADKIRALRELVRDNMDCYVRDKSGLGFPAAVVPNISIPENSDAVSVSLDITRIEE